MRGVKRSDTGLGSAAVRVHHTCPYERNPVLSSNPSQAAAGLSGNLRAIAIMAASTVAFVTMHAIVRHVSAGLHTFEVAFFRQFFGIFALLPWFIRYGAAPLRTQRLGLHAVRAAVNVVAMIAFYYALATTPLAQVSALAFSSPIFATIMAMLFLGEVVRLRRWIAILIGFAGVFIAFFPDLRSSGTVSAGSISVLLSSATWAVALILIKMLSRTESSLTITAYMVILMVPMSLGPAIFVWQWPTPGEFGWLAAAGVSGTLGQFLVTQALKEGDTNVVMPFDFLKLIWAATLGFLWFGEVPDAFTWMGGAMIFSATTYIAIREHQLRRRGEGPAEVPPPVPRTPAAS